MGILEFMWNRMNTERVTALMGLKGKQAKEKLKKYMLMQGNESIKKEFIQKYYRYAKLRYGIEDYFKLLQIH